MSAIKDEALTILMEECAEIIQAVAKIKRFGEDSINPQKGKTNEVALTKELADLIASMRLAEKHEAIVPPSEEMIIHAIARKRRYSSL